jgi:hypothetical protein
MPEGVIVRHEYQADSLESDVQSFIVRVWLEETAEEAGWATWRGHITHVPSGERRYLRQLDDITTFIASYLDGIGGEARRTLAD